MRNVLYMHETTFEYLNKHPDLVGTKQQVMISQYKPLGFNGIDIQISNVLKPTVNEPKKGTWIFPKERFVTYEPSDESWCRYFGIGREARGFILGEIIGMDEDFFCPNPMKRSRAFNPYGTR